MELNTSRYAIGSFSDHQQIESALDQLKQSNFSTTNLSILTQDAEQNDPEITSLNEFIRTRTVAGIAKGGLLFGSFGTLLGLLGVIILLALPHTTPSNTFRIETLLGSMATGLLYGLLFGVFWGAIFGYGLVKRQLRPYAERLAQGSYLVVIQGSEDELHQVESVLNHEGVQDWGVYKTV